MKFLDQVNDIKNTLRKAQKKTFILEFMKGTDPDDQRSLITKQVINYYRDDTNPFQTLMPSLFKEYKGVYPDGLEEDVRYHVQQREISRMLRDYIKENGRDTEKESEYLNSKEFDTELRSNTDKIVDKIFENKKSSYYVMVETDDYEYQSEMTKMPFFRDSFSNL